MRGLDKLRGVRGMGDAVVLIVNGGDWLSGPGVMQHVAHRFVSDGCWVSFGSHVDFPTAEVPQWYTDFDPSVYNDNSFRAVTPLGPLHLRAINYTVLSSIPRSALTMHNGTYWNAAPELALMLPAFERAGDRVCFINEISYVRNVAVKQGQLGDHVWDVNRDRRVDQASRIRLSPKLSRLPGSRKKTPQPAVWFNSPKDGDVIWHNKLILDVHSRGVWMPEEGYLVVYIHNHVVHRGNATHISISLLEMAPGHYEVSAVIFDLQDEPTDYEAVVQVQIKPSEEL